MKDLAEFLAGIVVPAWGVIAALLGTCGVLIGVIVTAWNSRRQLRIQLTQQSEENRVARIMTLRRDVYMEAAAAMARALSALQQFTDPLRDPRETAEQFSRDYAAISKVHVVASAPTLQALMSFTRELGQAQAELDLARVPLFARQRLIEASPSDVDALTKLVNEQMRARLDFAELVVGWSRRLAGRIPPALIAIRRELELPLEEQTYRDAFERAWAESEAGMRRLLERTRSEVP